MIRSILPVVLLLILGTTACAYKDDSGSQSQPNVLTTRQIQSLPVDNAYDVVRRLRPNWLRVQSAPTARNPTPERPVVYLDGVRSGSVGILRNIEREHVIRLEYLDPTDATQRYGTGHSGGVIRVTTG